MNIQAVVVWVLQWRQEVWRWGAQRPAIRSWQWPTESIIEADPLIIIGEVAEELNMSHSMVIWHLKQIGKVKKLDKWVPHELTKIPKNCHFEGSSSLILWNNNEPFLNQMVTYDKKCFLYDKQWWPAQWLDQEGQSTSQSQTPTQKGSRLLFGGLLSIWSTTAFWILAKPLHLRSMFSKSMRHTKKCNAYSRQWSTERAQFFSTTLPDHTSHNQPFKSWINWAKKFCLIHHVHLTSHQPTIAFSSILKTFCRENAFTTSRKQKMLSKSS